MKIIYIANVRMPTEKAHGLQIMKTCEAFADLGHTVELLVPRRKNLIHDDPFAYYSVRKSFTIRSVFSFDVSWGDKVSYFLQYISFSLAVMFVGSIRSADIVYGRDELALLAAACRTRKPVIWESHIGAWNYAVRLLVGRLSKIVVISHGLKDFYIQKGIPENRVVVAPDAVDLKDFANPESKESARKRLGLPLDKKIALYIGRLDEWKGADTLGRAADLLPTDTQVVMIGGEEDQVHSMCIKYPHAVFLGYHPYRELADNQAAADVLILPNSSKTEISARFTSPLKLFTYMAANRPIVASDLPSIREVLDETTAYMVVPDDASALASGITAALTDLSAVRKAENARKKVEAYTWSGRARGIISLLRQVR